MTLEQFLDLLVEGAGHLLVAALCSTPALLVCMIAQHQKDQKTKSDSTTGSVKD